MSDNIEQILTGLNQKANLKQEVYHHSLEVFKQFKECASKVVNTLAPEVLEKSPSVEISLSDYGEFEFHLKFSGDTIVFLLHTNVFAFPPKHAINKSKYTKENTSRGYFGMIQIYNFLSDSIKYNRLGDEGYLLARVFVNFENDFYVEGRRQLGFLYKELGKYKLDKKHRHDIIERCMLYCLDFDLIVPPTEALNQITVQQKNYFNNASGITTGKSLGFKVVNQLKNDAT
ncbi:MAG: hypothetical protein ACI9JN_000464 [Bacteroidia bacterium]|jgi:hypothetical protein